MAMKPMTWRSQAACRGSETALWFAEDQGEVKAAVAVCKGCPVREECLTWAIENGERFGVLGGMTERQRKAERSKRRRRNGTLRRAA